LLKREGEAEGEGWRINRRGERGVEYLGIRETYMKRRGKKERREER